MIIYHYTESGEYLGSGEADESPLEPGVFLVPRLATKIAPPSTGENEAAVFHDEQWSILPDFRGEEGWVNGVAQTIDTLGERPAGWSTEAPPPDAEPEPIDPLKVLNAKFKDLVPEQYHGAFAPLWATVRALIQAGETELAYKAVEAAQVPPALEAAKADFLALLAP